MTWVLGAGAPGCLDAIRVAFVVAAEVMRDGRAGSLTLRLPGTSPSVPGLSAAPPRPALAPQHAKLPWVFQWCHPGSHSPCRAMLAGWELT